MNKFAKRYKLLIGAIAISLIAHLIFAGVFRWPPPRPVFEEPAIVRMQKVRIVRQTPAPRRTASPGLRTVALRRSRVTPPHVTRSGKGPNVALAAPPAAPIVTPTPQATSSAAPQLGCAQPNVEAAIVQKPEDFTLDAAARSSKISGTAAITVGLDSQANVTGTQVSQSSGNADLDQAAIQMARAARYSPRYSSCKAVAGSYTFRVKFVAW